VLNVNLLQLMELNLLIIDERLKILSLISKGRLKNRLSSREIISYPNSIKDKFFEEGSK
jgi:hypothetical protein